jgi:negative regulator of flagellin synthesis FlgM
MNSKIDSYSTVPAALSALPRTPVKSAAGSTDSSSEAGNVEPVARVDSLKLTGNAVQLQKSEQSLASGTGSNADRVAALKQAVSSGSYQVDSRAVSDKLLRMNWQLGAS